MPRKKREGKVEHGHPRVVYDKPVGKEGQSDNPMDMTPTERRGNKVSRVNITSTNRKRKK